MVPLLAVVPFGPLMAWKRGDALAVGQRLMAAFAGALLAAFAVLLFVDGASVFAALGIGLAAWLILGALTDLSFKAGVGSVAPGAAACRRFVGLPRSVFGTALAHAGLGLTTLGSSARWPSQTEHILVMKPGDTVEAGGRTLRFEAVEPMRGPNFTEDRARFTILANGSAAGEIVAAKRFYPVRQTPTTEAGIRTIGFSQLYVSLGDGTADGAVVVRIWWKPLVTLIWLGAVAMMAGGTVSLLDRRLRVGAPAKRRRPVVATKTAA